MTAAQTAFDSTNYDDNSTATGFSFIPPDSHAAAGPTRLVNVVNVMIRFHEKTGNQLFSDTLMNFFTDLTPLTFTFDPKVLYDQFEDRFVVVTLERTDTTLGDPSNTSRIFLAVSDDANPMGTWTVAEIDSATTFIPDGEVDPQTHWADYPGFAVDEEAIYLTNNMFRFNTSEFGGVLLWIVDKGVSGGFYSGGAAAVNVVDPFPGAAGFEITTQPAHVYGTMPVGVGTFLTSYSGLSNGVDEFVQVVRVDDPLGTPTFTHETVNYGDVDDTAAAMPDAPQSGTGTLVATNDRRALDAVWRDGALYVTTTVVPSSGADSGQATARWIHMDTSTPGATSVVETGDIGGEDIATGTHTFFPSIATAYTGDVAIGFSASAATIFPGSYVAMRAPGDTAGTTRGALELRAGTDFYIRTFGSGTNRWGDYSGMSVEPSSGCFWAYNQYAMTRGSMSSGEDGRWSTTWGRYCGPSSELFADGFESGDMSAWSSSSP